VPLDYADDSCDDCRQQCRILAGCLDGPTGLKLDRLIFTDDKGDYYDIADGAKTFPQAG